MPRTTNYALQVPPEASKGGWHDHGSNRLGSVCRGTLRDDMRQDATL